MTSSLLITTFRLRPDSLCVLVSFKTILLGSYKRSCIFDLYVHRVVYVHVHIHVHVELLSTYNKVEVLPAILKLLVEGSQSFKWLGSWATEDIIKARDGCWLNSMSME